MTHAPRLTVRSEQHHFWRLPASHLGWLAAVAMGALTLWGLVLVPAHRWLRSAAPSGVWGQLTTGRTLVAVTVLMAALVLWLGSMAVRRGERSVLVLGPLAVGLFWMLFALGEVLAPH